MKKRLATCVAIIIEDPNGKVLLLQRDNDPEVAFANHWTLPGGVVEDDDDSPESAAIRELLEETGLRLPLSHWMSYDRLHQDRSLIIRQHIFISQNKVNATEINLCEGQAFEFFGLEELPELPIAYGFDDLLSQFFVAKEDNTAA